MNSSPFLDTINGIKPNRMPIWLMRQAGRYLPEYLAISAKYSFLEMCHQPELAVEISLQPIKRFDLDAAILFSDILTPLIPMGVQLDYLKGQGPVIANPIRIGNDVKKLLAVESDKQLSYVGEAIKILKRELPKQIPLLGFCGSPFTLASYMIEGGASKTYQHTLKFFNDYPNESQYLLDFLSKHITEYLEYKIRSGVDAVQIFESTGGALSRFYFQKFVEPSLKKVFSELNNKSIKSILYLLGGSHLQDTYAKVGCKVASLDWRIDLSEFRKQYPEIVTQGNLNPSTLFGGPKMVKEEMQQIVDRLACTGYQGHIFNLGHGILPGAPIPSVEAMIELVHGIKI